MSKQLLGGVWHAILIKIFEYEKSLKEPTGGVIRALYRHKNLPLVAKVIIETLFGEMLT